MLPQKRKFSELEADDLKIDEIEEFTEMYCPFIRGHYDQNVDIPKSRLYNWIKQNYGEEHEVPKVQKLNIEKNSREKLLLKLKEFFRNFEEKILIRIT